MEDISRLQRAGRRLCGGGGRDGSSQTWGRKDSDQTAQRRGSLTPPQPPTHLWRALSDAFLQPLVTLGLQQGKAERSRPGETGSPRQPGCGGPHSWRRDRQLRPGPGLAHVPAPPASAPLPCPAHPPGPLTCEVQPQPPSLAGQEQRLGRPGLGGGSSRPAGAQERRPWFHLEQGHQGRRSSIR